MWPIRARTTTCITTATTADATIGSDTLMIR